jgi:hypothetical protein
VAEHDWLVDRFDAHRAHLRAVAYRMLGSPAEADDAVQEAWLRLSRSDASEIENLGGWLTRLSRGLLDPDVVLEADATAVRMGSPAEVRGAMAVAGTFSGRALAARPALIDGVVGVVWAVDGRAKVAWGLTISHGAIVHIDMLAARDSLDGLDLTILDD